MTVLDLHCYPYLAGRGVGVRPASAREHPATVPSPGAGSRPMRPLKLAAIATPALLLAAGCASTPHHPAARHPARLTVLGDCRTLRADVLANGGMPDAGEVGYLLRQDPGNAGAVHGRHGLTFDLDWEYDAVTARDRGTPAGVLTIGTWQAALSGDCERAAGVTIPCPQS